MQREIYAYKCRKCGQLHYPYRMVCKKCRHLEHNAFDPVPLPKKGKLVTFTFVHSLPADFNVSKLGLGIVELENGLKITGQISIENPKIGMDVVGKVEIVRKEEFKQNYGMVFYKPN
ncbi:Zn-ribbon domain-containing OB-fold protein [Elusimicrobiota bacterium]